MIWGHEDFVKDGWEPVRRSWRAENMVTVSDIYRYCKLPLGKWKCIGFKYRVFGIAVNTFRNAYFEMSIRKYNSVLFIWCRNCGRLCGNLHGLDVCSFYRTADVDFVAHILPHSSKHIRCNRCSCLQNASFQYFEVLLAKLLHTPNS